MKSSSKLIVSALLVSLAVVGPASATTALDCTIVVGGAANVAEGDTPRAGEALEPGRRVAASSARPLELRLANGVEITLAPGASGVVMAPGELPTESGGWARGGQFRLTAGHMEMRAPDAPSERRAFSVSTPAGTLTACRGEVGISARGETVVAAAAHGALAIGANGVGLHVTAGRGVYMRQGGVPVATVGAPSPPVLRRGEALALVPPGGSTDLDLAWRPTERAARYLVEIAHDAKMTSLVRRETVDGTNTHFERAANGHLDFVRVRAIDADGLAGAWSDVQARRAVPVVVPAGGSIMGDGTYVIPPRAAVTLGAVAGLEVAYEHNAGDSARFALPLKWEPAPAELRLYDADQRVVHVRDRASGGATQMTIAARSLRAHVEVGPSYATWPRDPIDVSVTIVDPMGRTNVAAEHVDLHATLGLAPLAVAWHHEGNTYRARIPPRDSAGPWVVRVSATDSVGDEIGHGFLEVIADGTKVR